MIDFNLNVGSYFPSQNVWLITFKKRYNIYLKKVLHTYEFFDDDMELVFKGNYQESQKFLNERMTK